MKSSRKGWHVDAVMPGMQNEDMIDIAVAVDASGSIGEVMLRDFLSEVQGIMDQFGTFRIHLFTFDTTVYNAVDYNSDNLDSICDYEISGGGGTDFECIFHHLKEEQIEPRRLVVFTDGYPFGSWGDENYADTLWLIHGTKSVVPPWGQYAYYGDE
jgi:predicted metal-dependent peptidase